MTEIMTNYNGGGSGGLMFSSGTETTGLRGVSALHRRAEQLRRWEERERELRAKEKQSPSSAIVDNENRPRTEPIKTKIKFSNKTLFLASCAFNDYDEVDRLLKNNLVNINDCNIDGLTALHQACIDDNIDMVEYLIQHNADVNSCDNEGWTPLHATASCGHTSIVHILLDNGADPTLVNNDGELALDVADNEAIEELITSKLREMNIDDYEVLRKQEQIVMMRDINEWIKNGKLDDKPHPRTGATILHVAASKGYINIISKIFTDKTLRSQINVDAIDNEGWTPLAAAVYFQQPGSVELLLQRSANIEVRVGTGQSLFDLTDHELILKLLNDRKRLLDEQKLKAQQSNGPQGKVIPPSPPSVPTPNESETQRRAHAKRVRETRRSTQGITADDVKEAMDQLKQANTNINTNTLTPTITTTTNTDTTTTSLPPLPSTPTTTATVTTAINSAVISTQTSTPSTPTILAPMQSSLSSSSAVTTTSTIATTISSTPSSNTTSTSLYETPLSTPMAISTPSIDNKSLVTITATPTTQNNLFNERKGNENANTAEDTVDGVRLRNKDTKVPNIVEPSSADTENTNNIDQTLNLTRRKRNKQRRSTGTNPYDAVKAENINEIQEEKAQNGELLANVTPSTTPSNDRVLINKTSNGNSNNNNNNNEENKYPSTISSTSTGSSALQRIRNKQLSLDNHIESKDYKQLYEELVDQYEQLKKEASRKEQEWNREKRQLQRKIGELEEDCKHLENFRADNQRLKDENSALIRVISKLSK